MPGWMGPITRGALCASPTCFHRWSLDTTPPPPATATATAVAATTAKRVDVAHQSPATPTLQQSQAMKRCDETPKMMGPSLSVFNLFQKVCRLKNKEQCAYYVYICTGMLNILHHYEYIPLQCDVRYDACVKLYSSCSSRNRS